MSKMLDRFVSDFAKGLKAVDIERPIAISSTTQRAYQAGIGFYTETATLRLIRQKLAALNTGYVRTHRTGYSVSKSSTTKVRLEMDDAHRRRIYDRSEDDEANG